MTIKDIIKLYRKQLDFLDIELILSYSLKKTREFVLTYPEFFITKNKNSLIMKLIKRRIAHEPIAYIVKHKEFYGLDFIVNKTLIPRPETELLVEEIMKNNPKNKTIVDVGTGSGNIIITLAKKIKNKNNYIGIDISKKALVIARLNAKRIKVEKKIKFFQGNLLEPLLNKFKNKELIIIANLPYLSKKIYSSVSNDIKKYEPKSALYSRENGLSHYKKIIKQIIEIREKHKPISLNCLLEFSPEQKEKLEKLAKNAFPEAKIIFTKDFSGRWRICKIYL